MTEYKCLKCGGLQYTQDTHDTSPCIYCGGECEKVKEGETDEKKPKR